MEFDKPREACGVFGVYATPEMQVAGMAYLGLQAIQHRGQQGAGITVSNGERIEGYTDLGLVREVFARGKKLNGLSEDAFIATGHNRYQTAKTSPSQQHNALQPMFSHELDFEFTIAHNGHVEGVHELARSLNIDVSTSSSDTEAMKLIIAQKVQNTGDLVEALQESLPLFKGAYSLVLSSSDMLIAARDPQGFRPLHLGRLDVGGWVVASEVSAIDIAGASPVREIRPGEIVAITSTETDGLRSIQFEKSEPAICVFEFVYFSRPDNEMQGEIVVEVRERMGGLLAKGDNVTADMVIGVPDSGLAAADGYSREAGLPHRRALIRNNYVDRTFIEESQQERQEGVRKKLNPIGSIIKDKSCVVVDDSIVRGTTTKSLVKMLRSAGVSEVHLRISSPPYKWPCFYGMDTGRKEELLANNMSVEEMCDYIGADSLKFLSNKDLQTAVGQAAGKVCTACTTGVYPIEIGNYTA